MENIDIQAFLARQAKEKPHPKTCKLTIHVPAGFQLRHITKVLNRLGFTLTAENGDLIARHRSENN